MDTKILVFFALLYLICIFCIVKPDTVINLTAKYFKFLSKNDIHPTDKAKTVVRIWNVFLFILLTLFLFTGKF